MISHEQEPPLVTAVVICYNHSEFVIEALESVRAQTYPNLDLVVFDDCSKDDSVGVIRAWLSQFWPGAVFVAHSRNLGVCRTHNEALALAKGKYIRFLAADDRWVSNSLSRQVDFMEKLSEDVGVLYSDAYRIDEKGQLLPKTAIEAWCPTSGPPEGWVFDALLEQPFIPAMTALIRRRCFEVVGDYDEDLFFEDWDMWLRISRQFRFKYFQEPTAYYRFVQTSMTNSRRAEMAASIRRMLAKYQRRGWLAGPKRKEQARKQKKGAILIEYLEACRAYRQGLPGRCLETARVFRHRPCIKHALLLLFVVCGLPYQRFEQLVESLNNFKRRARFVLANRGIRGGPS